MAGESDQRPPSVTNGRTVAVGFLSLAVALAIARACDLSTAAILLLGLVAYAVPIALHDLLVEKVHRRPSTGLDWSRFNSHPVEPRRVAIKILGAITTFAMIGCAYAILPDGMFTIYRLFAITALVMLPVALIAGIFYIVLIDRVMVAPRDGYYEVGSLLLLRFRARDWHMIRDFVLGWAVKGFFLPLMLGALAINARGFSSAPVGGGGGIVELVIWLAVIVFLIDVVIGVCGYAITFRPLDTHIRSANSLTLGWIACLACYPPFHVMILHPLLDYQDEKDWHDWLEGTWLIVPWSILIAASYGMHLWSKVIFGLRFSNLTHRGIITNGPYRFTKHPDYLSKCFFWWVLSMPFLSVGGWSLALWNSLMLAGLNLVYFLRAKTEEKHLMQDPVYRAYAKWIAEYGAMTKIKRFWNGCIVVAVRLRREQA